MVGPPRGRPKRLARLWLRGGLPRSFLASNEAHSVERREEYVRTFLERDLPGFRTSANARSRRPGSISLTRVCSTCCSESARATSWSPIPRSALAELKLERLEVVHAGRDTYPLGERVRAMACSQLLDDLRRLGLRP